MSSERRQHIKQVVQAALELPADARSEFIEHEAAGDTDMREQVESLIRAQSETADFIEAPPSVENPLLTRAPALVTQAMDNAEREQALERHIGAYRIVRELGRGGMGAVYLAERADGEFRKQVAVKLIKRGMDTDFSTLR